MNDSRGFSFKRLHLTKDERMPKCYKDVEKIIKSVQSCQNNFKTAMANSRFRGGHFKKVYSLSLNVLKYYNYIQKIIEKTEILTKETFLRREIASILIYELTYGKGYLPGGNKIVTIVQAYEKDIFKVHEELQNNTDACELNGIYVPRYVRVHTLKTTVAYVIKDLESFGFKQILYEENISEERYLELVRNLGRGTFLVDFHFKDILVFAQDENLIELDLYKNGHIFLQDKASYIPVHVLNPEPGSTVLDACAAPGMKSAHIASQMGNKGILIACERDRKRFEILKETLEYGSVKIAKTLCTDFKLIEPSDEPYASVEYILLDPSCSGSGMVNRMDEVTNNEDSTSKERIQKLAGFQIILLKHALKFPSVKRVVYSTCSIHEEENEYVVHEALSAFAGSFKLVPVLPEWFSRGLGNYQYSNKCLRTIPTKHLTNGFFVAVFERIESYEHKDKYLKKYKKFKSSRDDSKKVYNPDRKSGSFPETKSKRAFKQEESCKFEEFNENVENNLLNSVDSKVKSKRVIKQEESCDYEELNKTNEDSLKFDESNERGYHSSNYEDANLENVIEFKSHKKKHKKSKHFECTDIEGDEGKEMNNHHCKAGKQSNYFSDSFNKSNVSSIVHSSSAAQMSSGLDNIVLGEKKSKHKKSHRTEKNVDFTEESSDLISKHKSKKKKKRKYSEISSNDDIAALDEQNNVNSSVTEVSKNNDNFNKNSTEYTANFIAGEDIDLETSPPKKHKKKKKKDYEVDRSSESCNHNKVVTDNSSDVQNPKHSNEVLNFSSQENSDLLKIVSREDIGLETSLPKKHKKKKKKDHEVDGSWNDNQVLIDNPPDVQNPERSNEVLNFSSQENSDLSQTRNLHFDDNDLKHTKSKKHKHKKHARKSDCEVLTENLDDSFPATVTKETNYIDAENILEISPKENNSQDKKITKRKKKKDKTHECSNNSDTSFQTMVLDKKVSEKLLKDELDTVTDNVQDEFPKRKRSKKHKSHLKGEV